MLKKLSLVLLTLTLVTLAVPVVSAESVDTKSEGFTMIPSEPNAINPRKFIFEIKPGESVEDFVSIKNLSDVEATYYLYGADPTVSAQGTPAYKTRQNGGDGEGSWVTFNEPQITLGAHQEKKVSFTVNVPAETKLADYRMGITMEKTKQDVNNPNVTIATRFILHADVKVTDNPSPVPKLEKGASPQKAGWQSYYFYISLVLFIGSFLALIWVTVQEKRAPHTAKPAAHRSTKTSSSAKKSRRK